MPHNAMDIVRPGVRRSVPLSRERALSLPRLPFSPVSLAAGLVGVLAIVYIALIAIVMSYAAHTIAFAQSVRTDEAAVGTLEAQYLAVVQEVTHADYRSLGYTNPSATLFVPTAAATALR